MLLHTLVKFPVVRDRNMPVVMTMIPYITPETVEVGEIVWGAVRVAVHSWSSYVSPLACWTSAVYIILFPALFTHFEPVKYSPASVVFFPALKRNLILRQDKTIDNPLFHPGNRRTLHVTAKFWPLYIRSAHLLSRYNVASWKLRTSPITVSR